MKLKELIKDLHVVEMTADEELEITAVCSDSREAVPGCLFIAITGYETDGHLYIASAAQKGACCVICQRRPEMNLPYVLVSDSRQALALVSAAYYGYPARSLKLIGVTGTNGKTTVTHLIKTILEKATGAKVGLIGTNGSLIGDLALETDRTTPESDRLQWLFARMRDAGCTYVVMEVSSHALYLKRVAGVHFAAAVFTNLTQDHLDFHQDMEDYFRAKAILFTQCQVGIINADDPWGQRLKELTTGTPVTYSREKVHADYAAENIRLLNDRVWFEAHGPTGCGLAEIGIPGSFTVSNGLAAIACCCALGLDLEAVCAALASAKGVKGRMEVVPGPEDFTVLIDYAHTPDALENVLKSLRGFAKGRVVCLFGCGGDRDRTKRPKMGAVAVALSDYVIVTSDNPRTEEPMAIIEDILEGTRGSQCPLKVICDRREAIRYAIENAREGDILLLAGKGHETYQILGKEKTHLDEREEVALALKRIKNNP